MSHFLNVAGVNLCDEPLEDGHYYVVDCVDIFDEYFKVPDVIRRPVEMMPDDFDNVAALAIELNPLIDCLHSFDDCAGRLKEHSTQIDDVIYQEPEIIDHEDGTHTTIPKIDTATVQAYSESLEILGMKLRDRLREAGYYNENGLLVGEFAAVLGEGLLVLHD